MKNHQKPDGNITQNFLVRDGEQMFSDWLDKQIDKEELRRGLAMEEA